jgi:hypothetical protein
LGPLFVACGLGRGQGRLWDVVGRVKMVQRHSELGFGRGRRLGFFLREVLLGEEERRGRKWK